MASTAAPQPARERGDPAIRTMRSDISEFLRTTKPSLVSLLVQQAQWEEAHGSGLRPRRRMFLATLAILGGAALVAGGGIIAYQWSSSPPPTPGGFLGPPAYIFYESLTPISAEGGRTVLLDGLSAAGRAPQAPGTLRRILVTAAGAPMAFDAFLRLANGSEPPAFAAGLSAPPQLFIYRRGAAADAGALIEPKSPGQTLRELLAAEPSLARDLEALFIGVPPPPTLAAYEDRTYRNLDFRYRRMAQYDQRGLGYLFFPARRLIVMATSEEAIRAVVDRLFLER